MLEIGVVICLWLYIVLQLLVLTGYFSGHPKPLRLLSEPKIAILIPARNEAENIAACLDSILRLNYPTNQMEVWVGNDHSEDQTANIVQDYVAKFPHIHLYEVKETLGSARAKSNVLAQLMKQVNAPYIFVTDADIIVNENWVAHLLPYLQKEKMGIVSGTTLVDGEGAFAKYQGLDWALGNGYLIGLDRLGLKSTAVGNNMCFTQEAYQATGGYESMPFSVTEDFQLFKAIRKKGYDSLNFLEADSLNISQAQSKLGAMLHQRKRWMQGARDLPWYWLLIFGLQALYSICLITLFILHPGLALTLLMWKLSLQTVYLYLVFRRLKTQVNWIYLLSFEGYSILIQLAMVIFYLVPVKMVWKRRTYN